MRWMRILAVIAALLGVAVVVLVVALNRTDWSRYQEPIVTAVRQATGRELAIDGALRLHIGFRPSIYVEGVHLQNAAWGSQADMVRVGRFEVQLALLPLLFRRVEVSRIVLSEAEIALETNAEGKGNWVFESATAAEAPEEGAAPSDEDPAATEPESAPDAPGDELMTLVDELRIDRLRLSYRDGTSGESREVSIAELRARLPDPAAPLEIEASGALDGEAFALAGAFAGVLGLTSGKPLGVDLEATAGGATLTVDGEIAEPLDARGIALSISIAGQNLATLSPLAGSALPPLGPYRVALDLAGGGDRYSAENLDVRVGSSELRGRLGVDLAGERPSLRAALTSPRLSLADFQSEGEGDPAATPDGGTAAPAPGGSGPKGGAAADAGRVFSEEPLDLAGLGAADARIELEAAQVIVNDATLEAVKLGLALQAGRLRVDPIQAKLAEGTLGASLGLDSVAAPPRLEIQLDTVQVDVGSLLSTLRVSEALSGGKVDVGIQLGGSGDSPAAIARSLAGEIALEMGPGQIHNEWAERVFSNLGSLLIGDASGDRTNLNCVVSRFEVADGLARTRGVAVDSQVLALLGSGRVNVGAETLALRFDPVLKKADVGSVIPAARIDGTFLEPDYGIDKSAVAGKLAGLAEALVKGDKVAGGRSIETATGVPGCEDLIARSKELTGGTRSADKQVEKKVKKATRKTKKKLKKKAGKALDGLLGR